MIPTKALPLGLISVAGVGLAVQSLANSALGGRWSSPFAAALWSFLSGLVLITAIALCSRAGRSGLAAVVAKLRDRSLPVWQVLGGVAGASIVLAQALTVQQIGVALFTVAFVAGQISAGLIVDHRGLAPGQPRSATRRRIFGAVVVVAAVVLMSTDRLAADPNTLLALAPFGSGMLVAVQQAGNARLREAVGSALSATVVNFLTGGIALTLVLLVSLAVAGPPSIGLGIGDWWMLVGGVVGVVFIGLNVVVVGRLGVLLSSLGALFGQLVGSLCIDLFFPQPGSHISGFTFAGIALVLVGVVIVMWPDRPPHERTVLPFEPGNGGGRAAP